MDISSILNDKPDGSAGFTTVPTDVTDDSGSGNNNDPLSDLNFDGDEDGKLKFNINDTIDTSDNSSVGDYNSPEEPKPEHKPFVRPTPKAQTDNNPADFVITDPAKMDFVKTYTKEYDDLVASATHAVELILASIDKTVQDHSNDIDIPEEAMPFLTDKPKDNKVQKFDEAQEIVRTVMEKASNAKTQSEQAAMEAAKIYDDIQQFKRDTEDEIASIRNRDEFGRPKTDLSGTGATVNPAPAGTGELPTISKM